MKSVYVIFGGVTVLLYWLNFLALIGWLFLFVIGCVLLSSHCLFTFYWLSFFLDSYWLIVFVCYWLIHFTSDWPISLLSYWLLASDWLSVLLSCWLLASDWSIFLLSYCSLASDWLTVLLRLFDIFSSLSSASFSCLLLANIHAFNYLIVFVSYRSMPRFNLRIRRE